MHKLSALLMMACGSLAAAFHHSGNLAYQVGTFNSRTLSSVSNKAFLYAARTRSRGATSIEMVESDHWSNHNYVLRFIGVASFALLSYETMAQAFVPDLSSSPLKNSPPTIVVEGVPRVVDGIQHFFSSSSLILSYTPFDESLAPCSQMLSLQGIPSSSKLKG
jgi:hypothetical protein